ncbi:MAG: hypothetical protein SynsKO_19610 [Synoicihabitans sp.]
MTSLPQGTHVPFSSQPAPPKEVPSAPPFAASYRATQLQAVGPDQGFKPAAINEAGRTIGNIIDRVRFEGASWNARGWIEPPVAKLPPSALAAERALPCHALSANGLVAGTLGGTADRRGAWASHLGEFGRRFWPDNLSFGQGVNSTGLVVGKALLTAEPVLVARAFAIEPHKRPRYFNAPEGGLTDAVAVNDAGMILFNITGLGSSEPQNRAWLWQQEEFIPLAVPPRCSSAATALNAHGHVVGEIETEFGLRRPTVWIDGEPQDLETTMAENFVPTCINDDLIVGGSALNPQAQRSACLWTPSHGLRFLNDCGGPESPKEFQRVDALNNSGQILATHHIDGQPRGYRLAPTG